MNIEKIKSELECLTQIVSAWSNNNPIAAIERDLALDKLLKIYDLVRFARNNDEKEIETPIVAPIPVAADSTEPKAEPAAEEVDEDYELYFDDIRMNEIKITNPFTEEKFMLCYAVSDKTYNFIEMLFTPRDKRHTLLIK
mgnify:CR=1 FL=1